MSDESRKVYDKYQRAQRGDGYLLIGIKGKQKRGKQIIVCFPSDRQREIQR